MTKRKLTGMIALLLVAVFVVAACGGGGGGGADGGETGTTPAATATPAPTPPPTPPPAEDAAEELANALEHLDNLLELWPMYFANPNPIIPGGVFRFALPGNSPITGILMTTHSQTADDGWLTDRMMSSVLSTNESLMFSQQGIATYEFDVEAMTFTVTMRDDINPVYWHDGTPFTLDSILFAYETISHPNYTGTRFSAASGFPWILGIEEFRRGEVDYIAGIVLSDDERQITFHYNNFPPSMLYAGIWMSPLPRHHWEGIAAEDMSNHENARLNPLGFGPFILEAVVPGESFLFRANDNYYRGRPIIDYLLAEQVVPDVQALAMQAGQFDYMGFRMVDIPDYGDSNNFTMISALAGSIVFQTFRFGHRTTDEDGVASFIPHEDGHPTLDVNVRRAMAYAIDYQAILNVITQGFAVPAITGLSPFNARGFMDVSDFGTSIFNPELANQILDDAGYSARDAQGYRLDLNGEPFQINWAMNTGANNEIRMAAFVQNLSDVGLRVIPWTGALVDWQFLMDTVNGDGDVDPAERIHIFQAGWSLGFNPSPSALWGYGEAFNQGRWGDPRAQQIIDRINSPAAWDVDYVADAYREWQSLWNEAIPAITESYGLAFVAVNNRAANVSLIRMDGTNQVSLGAMHLWGLTADEPYVH